MKEMLNITDHQGSLIKATMRSRLTPVRMAVLRKTTDTKCWWKGSPPVLLVGDVKWCSQFGKSLAITQRAKHKVIILSNNSTNLDTPKRMKTCATQKPVHKCSQYCCVPLQPQEL